MVLLHGSQRPVVHRALDDEPQEEAADGQADEEAEDDQKSHTESSLRSAQYVLYTRVCYDSPPSPSS